MKYSALARSGVAAVVALSTPAAMAFSFDAGNTQVSVGGYIKVEAMVSDYDGAPAASGLERIGRDFYVGPSSIPIDDGKGQTVFDMHARQTRFNMKTVTDMDGEKLTGFLELDFLVTDGGNEVVSNSYVPRLRHAFLSYGNWLFGQTWSTFQNVGALPDTLEFIGPAESTIFVRQPIIRYTTGNFQVAIENPQNTGFGGDTNDTPDIALRLNMGNFVLAGIIRSLQDETIDERAVGGGVSFSGKVPLGRNDIRFMLSAGNGIGRYLGVNANSDGRIENGDIETNDTVAGYVAYRQVWSDKARSTVSLGFFSGDDEAGDTATESAHSAIVNYIYSPQKNLDVGVELANFGRELNDGSDGAFSRLHFSARLAF